MRYNYVAWKEEGIWTAHTPSMPGVYGLGSSHAAAAEDLVAALDTMLDYLTKVESPALPKKPQKR